MAELVLDGNEARVRLSRWERLGALRGDVVVPRSAVVATQVVEDASFEVRGMRAPGYSFPGHGRVGTWRRPGHRDFVVTYGHRPGLVVELRGQRFDRLILSMEDPVVARELATALLR